MTAEYDEFGQPIEEVIAARSWAPSKYVLDNAMMNAVALAVALEKQPHKRSTFEQCRIDGTQFERYPKLRRGPRPESWPAHWPVMHRVEPGERHES